MNTKRIEFIDLAKGICIILVIAIHCNIYFFNITFPDIIRMPLYFILSGLFFKDYGGLSAFMLKKINKLLTPFIFFYFSSYILLYLFTIIIPTYQINNSIFDIFITRTLFNGPIWFLLALFWCNLFFYLIKHHIKNTTIAILIIILLGYIGYTCGMNGINFPLFADNAISMLPFFAFGFYIRKTNFLYPNKYDRWNIVLSMVFIIFLVLTRRIIEIRPDYFSNHLSGGFVLYLVAIVGVVSILLFCKVIKKLPIISFIGRYSIIFLGVHFLFIEPLKILLSYSDYSIINNNWTLFLLVLTICYGLVPICIRFIPWFIAQKDLITVSNGKLKFISLKNK